MTFEKEWTSHIPLLIKVMEQSEGPVLELGAGPGSTPLLYWLCFDQDRQFTSYDHNPEYVETFSKLGVQYAEDWDKVPIDDTHWGVVFIDHDEQRRHVDVARLAKNADHIVIHDSQKHLDRYFHYKSIYHLFSFKYVYRKVKPHTTVLSRYKEFKW